MCKYTGTFPMGLATIINMIIFVCVPSWGHGMAIFAWVLWWIDAVIALAANFFIPFIIMRNDKVRDSFVLNFTKSLQR